jgi:hypothetical protein
MNMNMHISRKKIGASILALAIGVAISPLALAEKSEGETPVEEQELAIKYQEMPEAAKVFVAYLEDLDKRYPDSAKVDIGAFMETEGETLALHYCAANGIDGACAPVDAKDGTTTMVPVDTSAYARNAAARGRNWWQWLYNHSFNVGVIPETNACPAGTTWTQIHMDDEDRRNANSRGGWIGAISSDRNTTYRFCKLDPITSLNFRPIDKVGDQMDYSVVNMGIFCPSGARRLVRVEENEIWRNASSSSGDVFPNFRIYNTWFNFYCHFDGGANSLLGRMNEFPKLAMPYGVFASRDMPAPFALAKGWVHQDDEDFLNWNGWWFGSGDSVMAGGSNTQRWTAKVK